MRIGIQIYDTPMSEDKVEPQKCIIEVRVKRNHKAASEYGRAVSIDEPAERVISAHKEYIFDFVQKVIADAKRF